MRKTAIAAVALVVAFSGVRPARADSAADAAAADAAAADGLAAGFSKPPESAKPRTWWHWLNGCVGREGITADLEAMKRAGLGGFTLFNVDQLPIDDPSVRVLNPKWRELAAFAADEAARLGLEMGFHNTAGWSSSGGPWIRPELSMQQVVATGQPFKGPGRFTGTLKAPKATAGYYEDVAVLAFPAKAADEPVIAPLPTDISRLGILPTSIDLTSRMDASGNLAWDAPAGDWVILRLGHTSTGRENGPAPESGRGLECDKYNPAALDAHFAGYPAQLLDGSKADVGKSLTHVLIDSYEVGGQNWSPVFREEFKKRRGYDPLPWLPVVLKHVLVSPAVTARVLWDWKQTGEELFADNYYGHMAELVHRYPGVGLWVEPYTGPFDTLTVGGRADVPMSEFWAKPSPWGWNSLPPVSSAAHTWGKAVVAAESFTGWPIHAWQFDPYALKSTGDRAFCLGVNRIVLHTTPHQPWGKMPAGGSSAGDDVAPGMTAGWWGTQFGRTVTWWDHGGPQWFAYLARCQFLLQQGLYVGDVCTLAHAEEPVKLPVGYEGDTIGVEALLTRVSVRDHRLVLPDGMSYRLLALPDRPMLPAVARKVKELVEAGAAVVGTPPASSPSYQGYPACDEEVRKLAADVWGDGPAAAHALGQGRAFRTHDVEAVLTELGVEPDVRYRQTDPLVWIHRKVGDADIYFISNQSDEDVRTEPSFRVSGKLPEVWRPDAGTTEAAAVWRAEKGRTVVPLTLGPSGSVFVVFRKPAGDADPVVAVTREPEQGGGAAKGEAEKGGGAEKVGGADDAAGGAVVTSGDGTGSAQSLRVEAARDGVYDLTTASGKTLKAEVTGVPAAVEIAGPWELAFPPHWGPPANVTLDRLVSWTDHPDRGVKYFSGTATYAKDFDAPADLLGPGRVVYLDLGVVKNVAEVKLNGADVGTLWKPPFRTDVTVPLLPGRNHLEIRVTNLWPNRLIGDEQEPDDCEWAKPQTVGFQNGAHPVVAGSPLKTIPQWLTDGTPRPSQGRYTFTTYKYYTKDSPLMESGLIGPVKLVPARRVGVK